LKDLLEKCYVLPFTLQKAWDDYSVNDDLDHPGLLSQPRNATRTFLVKDTALGKALGQAATMMGATVVPYPV